MAENSAHFNTLVFSGIFPRNLENSAKMLARVLFGEG